MRVDSKAELRIRPETFAAGTKPPQLLGKSVFRNLFADRIRAASTHVNPHEVIPVRGTEFHMWMLPLGELRKIPDQEHERTAREIFETIGLQGSSFIDNDGTRFREKAIVDGGIIKVCSHQRQLQISLPVDVTDAQLRALYGLSRTHANESLVWDIHGSAGEIIAKSPNEIDRLSTVSWRMLLNKLRDANK